MGWSGITSITTYSAGNAQAISIQAGEMVRIRTIRPTTGPDGSVVIYDQTGAPIQTITVTGSNPDQTVAFATSATSLNYSTTVAFDAPGLQISWQASEATPSYDPSTGGTAFGGAVKVGKLAALADLANLPAESSINGVSSGLIYNHATGQKIFDGNKLFSAYVADGSAFTAASESTVITPVVIASQHNVDGKYNRLSKHKIPPVIRAGFMAAKEDIIHSHFEMGGNFSTTPTGKTLTLREYWLQPNDTATKMLEIVIDGANLAAWTSGSNRPIHIFADYNIDNIVSASSQKVRVHWRVFVGKLSSGQLWDAGESFFGDYPICNMSVENRIKWTAQWNVTGGTLYSDNLEYWL